MLNLEKLEQNIKAQMKANQVPGLAHLIMHNHEVIYAGGFGVTSVEDGGTPVTTQTLFRIGSTTKPLVGTAIMRLVESGKLDLDSPIKNYISWFSLSEEGAAECVTLRMLMSHTAGLPNDSQAFGECYAGALEAYVREKVSRYRLIAPPGKLFSYSNPSLVVVGYCAEVVSGKPFTELMQELVFEPLKMQRTTFEPTVAMTYPLAQAHSFKEEDETLIVEHRFADNCGEYPSGFAMSTVFDLANFATMQMNQGNFLDKKVLSPESVGEMQKIQADYYVDINAGYGLTFYIRSYNGKRLISHGGELGNFQCHFSMIPDTGTAIIMLHNRNSYPINSAFETIIHQSFDQLLHLSKKTPQTQKINIDNSLWQYYTGSYLSLYCGLAIIEIIDNQLSLNWNGENFPLVALREDLYFNENEEVYVGFIREKDGLVNYIFVDGNACQRIELDTSFVPDSNSWKAYVDKYSGYLMEDAETLTITLAEDNLFIYFKCFDEKMLCVPLSNTRFACRDGIYEFLLDEDGTYSKIKAHDNYILNRQKV